MWFESVYLKGDRVALDGSLIYFRLFVLFLNNQSKSPFEWIFRESLVSSSQYAQYAQEDSRYEIDFILKYRASRGHVQKQQMLALLRQSYNHLHSVFSLPT